MIKQPSIKDNIVSMMSSLCLLYCCCFHVASVMSNSVWPHRRQPTRLPVPGILQARTLEWVGISFSNAWKWKVKMKLLSHVRLLATPWTVEKSNCPIVINRMIYADRHGVVNKWKNEGMIEKRAHTHARKKHLEEKMPSYCNMDVPQRWEFHFAY